MANFIPEFANSIPKELSVNEQTASDGIKCVSYQDIFGQIDDVFLILSETLEFMKISKSKFLNLLATNPTWSKLQNRSDQKFLVQLLTSLKKKLQQIGHGNE